MTPDHLETLRSEAKLRLEAALVVKDGHAAEAALEEIRHLDDLIHQENQRTRFQFQTG